MREPLKEVESRGLFRSSLFLVAENKPRTRMVEHDAASGVSVCCLFASAFWSESNYPLVYF